MSVGFTSPESPLHCKLDDAVAAIAQLLEVARAKGVPVVYTTLSYGQGQKAVAKAFIDKVPALLPLPEGSPFPHVAPPPPPPPDAARGDRAGGLAAGSRAGRAPARGARAVAAGAGEAGLRAQRVAVLCAAAAPAACLERPLRRGDEGWLDPHQGRARDDRGRRFGGE